MPVIGNPGHHLAIMSFSGRDIDPGRGAIHQQPLGISAFSRPRAAENEGQTRQERGVHDWRIRLTGIDPCPYQSGDGSPQGD
jgi:hypothetical protein